MSSCPNCGHVDAEDHDFCKSCGTYLRWEESAEESKTAVLKVVTLPPEALASFAQPPPVSSRVAQPAARAPEPAREPVRGGRAVVTLRLPEEAGSSGGSVTAKVDAGGEAELVATVRNESEIVDDYDLHVTGIPEGWWTITPQVLYLVPFGAESGSYEQDVTIRLHPPRQPEAEARLWPIRLVATSHARGTEGAGSARAGLVIAPYGGFESRVTPERAHGETSARFAVPVRSAGNAPLAVSFHGEDPDGEMSFAFDPPTLTVPPAGEAVSTVTISAERAVKGEERERAFTVYVRGEDQVLAGTAVFVQRPTVTRERLGLWRVALTLLAAALLIGGSFMNWASDSQGALQGACTARIPSGCLRFDEYLLGIGPDVGLKDLVLSHDAPALLNLVTSLGFLTIVLGALALIGIRKGRLAWLTGTVTVIVMLVFLLTLREGASSAAGAWVVLLGGLLALTAGVLTTLSRKDA